MTAGGPAVSRTLAALLDSYRHMVTARLIEEAERRLVAAGAGHFRVSGAGHEFVAVLDHFMQPQDYLHAHYRDKALLLARGLTPKSFLDALLCNAASHSAGRQMSAHMCDAGLRILSMVGPVGNNALQAVGVAEEARAQGETAITLCAVGDGTTQQGEFYEAVAEAARRQLPVLFLVENNALAISTPTAGKSFFDMNGVGQDAFFGVPIVRARGADLARDFELIGQTMTAVRAGAPRILVLDVDRHDDHTNGDDQSVYLDMAAHRARIARTDPNARVRALLLEAIDEATLNAIERKAEDEVSAAAEAALAEPAPAASHGALLPHPKAAPFAEVTDLPDFSGLSMAQAIKETLRLALASDPRVSIYGEDIADPKGDVFGLTRGLSSQFAGRVENSPLSEATIVGKAAGRALAGGRPVAMLQFADFVPIAFNQIAAELATMAWRTDGKWTAPVVVMAPVGGYRAGLGPFHAQTFEATLAHIPGLNVVMPSTADDAAALLGAALSDSNPTLFLYPKVCLNDPALAATQRQPMAAGQIGLARQLAEGDEITLLSYGGTMPLVAEAARLLQTEGVGVDLIDLRSIAPWDKAMVARSVNRTGRLVVVHEDNLSFGVGREIVATLKETHGLAFVSETVARPDTHVPCNYPNQLEILPSTKSVVEAAARLLGREVAWDYEADDGAGLVVAAIGSSPADQNVTVIEWFKSVGDSVTIGEHIADLEADKAVFEFAASANGVISDLFVKEGQQIRVGDPLLRLTGVGAGAQRAAPKIVGMSLSAARPQTLPSVGFGDPTRFGIVSIATRTGTKRVSNADMARRFPDRAPEDILKLTGIVERGYFAPDAPVIDIAADAAREALRKAGLTVADLSAVLCSTSTLDQVVPSMACRVLDALGGETRPMTPAHDILSACSGFIYGLADAYRTLMLKPDGAVLILTIEQMSKLVDENDFDTASVFSDAITATVVGAQRPQLRFLTAPQVFSGADRGHTLEVDITPAQRVSMLGKALFPHAVRGMKHALNAVCGEAGVELASLDHIVPHQANQRIIDSVAKSSGIASEVIVSTIAHHGNTSSSSIPLALSETMQTLHGKVGLCAFGGGYTFGAALFEAD